MRHYYQERVNQIDPDIVQRRTKKFAYIIYIITDDLSCHKYTCILFWTSHILEVTVQCESKVRHSCGRRWLKNSCIESRLGEIYMNSNNITENDIYLYGANTFFVLQQLLKKLYQPVGCSDHRTIPNYLGYIPMLI